MEATEVVPYSLAILAKNKGFDEFCLAGYTSKLTDNNFNQLWFTDQIFDRHENSRYCQNSDFGNAKSCSAPTHQQIVDWFREKHDLHIIAVPFKNDKYDYELIYDWIKEEDIIDAVPTFNSYYEALNAGIEESFKIITCKSNKN